MFLFEPITRLKIVRVEKKKKRKKRKENDETNNLMAVPLKRIPTHWERQNKKKLKKNMYAGKEKR